MRYTTETVRNVIIPPEHVAVYTIRIIYAHNT